MTLIERIERALNPCNIPCKSWSQEDTAITLADWLYMDKQYMYYCRELCLGFSESTTKCRLDWLETVITTCQP